MTQNKKRTFNTPCKECNGRGRFSDLEDSWECCACHGTGFLTSEVSEVSEMKTKDRLHVVIHDLQHDKDQLEIELACAADTLLAAEKELEELEELEEPTMAVDTLCEVWENNPHERFRYFSHTNGGEYYFFRNGVTSKTNGIIDATVWPNFRVIEEPELPWKDIDDNIPEATTYAVKLRGGAVFLTDMRRTVIDHFSCTYLILRK